ncbi:MAG: DUF4981 domain-containing protein [Clostridiales bacterium]|nr:DUF4981 domain-containing protein [Clostridiales bacterium]
MDMAIAVKPWYDFTMDALNREGAHIPWGAYEDREQALSLNRWASRRVRSLDGEWKFHLYPSPEAVPDRPDDAELDSTAVVPGNFELQGHLKPIYTNVLYPWHYEGRQALSPGGGAPVVPNPPFIPEDNPTAVLSRTFDVDQAELSMRAYLDFGGVEGAFALYINGAFVGFSQDSKLPSEFDITDHVRPGENRATLVVCRWSAQTYLEDQDYWHLMGAFRPVRLLFKPALHIRDLRVEAGADGRIVAEAEVSRVPGFADATVAFELLDADGRPVFSAQASPNGRPNYRQDAVPRFGVARVRGMVDGAATWSHERPTLYTLVVSLVSGGEAIDFESARVGFRDIEIQNGVILLNGRRLIVRGVNRHEFWAPVGRAVPIEHVRRELLTMKKLGINAVRTCHYPDDPRFYDLCDELGLLVVCECDLETHGVSGMLTHDPAWAAAFVTRAQRMVMTHKLHPCIFSWSLGNESGAGANHAAMAGWIREYDQSRLCQYESGFPGKRISDVRGWMYAPLHEIMGMLTDPGDDRPIVLVEFSYQIRNSGGGLHKFQYLINRYPRFQGGFIWDWQDKALVCDGPDGQAHYAIGGDFGEDVVDTECPVFMCCNGIVLPDLTPKPSAIEAQYAYCPILIERPIDTAWTRAKTDSYLFYNQSHETDLGRFDVRCTLTEDGIVVSQFTPALPDLAPGQSAEVEIPVGYARLPGREYHLNIEVLRAEAAEWGAKGDVIGGYQFALPGSRSWPARPGAAGGKATIEKTDDGLILKAGDRFARFDAASGLLAQYGRGDQAMLLGAAECFTRPYSGLDYHIGIGSRPLWDRLFAMGRELCSFDTSMDGDCARIRTRSVMCRDDGFGVTTELCYGLYGDGTLALDMAFDVDGALLHIPRAGIELIAAEGLDNLRFYGRGPGENYCDRVLSAPIGVYETTVAAQHFPFIPPAECGGHEDVRHLALSGGERSLTIVGERPFHFDARYTPIASYAGAMHDFELQRGARPILHVDAAHAGIGGDMAWSSMHDDADRVLPGLYRLKLYIRAE